MRGDSLGNKNSGASATQESGKFLVEPIFFMLKIIRSDLMVQGKKRTWI